MHDGDFGGQVSLGGANVFTFFHPHPASAADATFITCPPAVVGRYLWGEKVAREVE